MDLDIPHGPRLVLLTILRHISWKDGGGCRASVPTLAQESQFSSKTLKGHLKYLVKEGLISRLRHIGRPTETRLGTVGVETTPTVGEAPTPETSSSSTSSINQLVPVVDTKEVVEIERTTQGAFTVFEEEGATRVTTGVKASAQDVQEWLDRNCPEHYQDPNARPFASDMLTRYKADWWSEPAGTRKGGWEPHMTIQMVTEIYTKTASSWRKFHDDVQDKLIRGGALPELTTSDTVWCLGCSKDTTTGHGNAFLQGGRRTVDTCEDCAQAPVPIVEIIRTGHRGLIRCEGCGKKIKREPDKTHCYSCSKKLVDGPALARTL